MSPLRLRPLCCLVALALAALAPPARAQDATTGTIAGRVTLAGTDTPVAYATVVVTGPDGRARDALTDDDGVYRITHLPPGNGYTVAAYYGDDVTERHGIRVSPGRTATIVLVMSGEHIVVHGEPATLDLDNPKIGERFEREDLLRGAYRDAWSAAGSTAGSQFDGVGVAIAGSTGAENLIMVDGISTTGLAYGTAGAPVRLDFIEEMEVITGGYGAEYGRSTGGIVSVVTRRGTNHVTGSVFAYVTPGALVAARERTPSQATSIDAVAALDHDVEAGFEVGGPLRKDLAWFWIGVAPRQATTTVRRITRRRTDCRVTLPSGELSTPADAPCTADAIAAHADGVPDLDPATGFLIYEDVDARTLRATSRAHAILAKVDVAPRPEHQGQISISVQPGTVDGQRVHGFVEQQRLRQTTLTTDVALKWTSKLHDDKTELEAVIGLHRDAFRAGAADGARDADALQVLYFGNLGTWAQLGGESMATAQGCTDNTGGDPYRFITNCPDVGVGYAIGGPGRVADDVEQRASARLGVLRRFTARGTHAVKAGIDVEDNRIDHLRTFSGDALLENLLDRAEVRVHRWVQLEAPDAAGADLCRDRGLGAEHACRTLRRGDDAARIRGRTINWAAFVRDAWQPRPDLTLNAGLRYEEQRLRHAAHLQGTTDPLTGREIATDAMVLDHLWAPRLGFVWDPTKQARGKVYGHWGRYFESVPLDINDRAFGGEVLYEQRYDARTQCGPAVEGIGGADGNGCLAAGERPALDERLFGSGVLVAPGIGAQYLDEVVLGAEAEIADGLVVGAAWQARRLGRVIEDVSTDGAQTYVIANPGEWSEEEERRLRARIDATTDPAERARLEGELAHFLGIRAFDRPRRDHDALLLTAAYRARGTHVRVSYTYARTRGNYPGLVSYDNGQLDPNISSQYDLIELLANREGPLPQDRPHYVKVDGFHAFDLRRAGRLIVGVRARALSGTPVDVLAGHYRYGPGETFLLPRGSLRRTDFETGLDLHVSYGRALGRGVTLEVFADLFNVMNEQGTFSVDERYTVRSNANPIVGGTYHDLIWAKEVGDNGFETTTPIKRNPNFGRPAARYAPASARLGARLTF